MYDIATQLISLLAEGLGKRRDYFDPWFKDSCASTLRAINYLPRNHKRAMDHSRLDQYGRVLVTPEHADSGFITVLSTFAYPGL